MTKLSDDSTSYLRPYGYVMIALGIAAPFILQHWTGWKEWIMASHFSDEWMKAWIVKGLPAMMVFLGLLQGWRNVRLRDVEIDDQYLYISGGLGAESFRVPLARVLKAKKKWQWAQAIGLGRLLRVHQITYLTPEKRQRKVYFAQIYQPMMAEFPKAGSYALNEIGYRVNAAKAARRREKTTPASAAQW